MSHEALGGKAILVVEDEYVIAADLCQELERIGARIIGPVPSVCRGSDLIKSGVQFDAAVLDVNLQGELAFGLADMLQDREIPFLFLTGYEQSVIPTRFANVLCCEKPLAFQKLSKALTSILHPA